MRDVGEQVGWSPHYGGDVRRTERVFNSKESWLIPIQTFLRLNSTWNTL